MKPLPRPEQENCENKKRKYPALPNIFFKEDRNPLPAENTAFG